MLRMTMIMVAVASLAPMGPMGCPPLQNNDDMSDFDGARGEFTITASAPQSASTGQVVTLSAVPETGATGVTYAWLQMDGPGVLISGADSRTASFSAPSIAQDETLEFMVTAYDEAGDVGRDTVSVLIAADPTHGQNPTGPVADAGVDRAVAPGTTVTLDGSGSRGQDLTYSWRMRGGTSVSLRNSASERPSFVAPELDGASTVSLTFELTVTDAQERTATDTVRITVAEDAVIPAAADAGEDISAYGGEEVVLDGTGSTGDAITYAWTQTAGAGVAITGADTATPSFTAPAFEADGENSLVFTLTVTDSTGKQSTDEVTVTILDESELSPRVKVVTTMGDFVIELDRNKAPISTENFLQYVDDRFYDSTIFHRVIPDFVVQGGGFTPGLNRKETRDPIVNEASNGLTNDRGTVAMARTQDPDSATSQWYVNLIDNDFLNYQSEAEPGYAVFGRVVEGMDVVDRIAQVETGQQGGMQDVPLEDVLIRRARRLDADGGEIQ